MERRDTKKTLAFQSSIKRPQIAVILDTHTLPLRKLEDRDPLTSTAATGTNRGFSQRSGAAVYSDCAAAIVSSDKFLEISQQTVWPTPQSLEGAEENEDKMFLVPQISLAFAHGVHCGTACSEQLLEISEYSMKKSTCTPCTPKNSAV